MTWTTIHKKDETEEEEEYVPRSLTHYESKKALRVQKVLYEDSQEDLDSNAHSLENYEDIPISRGKSFIQDDLLKESGIVNKTYNSVT
mgnify:CR=1 FL=1